MPSDASIYDNLNKPATPLLNPLDIRAKQIAIRNALAAGALQDQQIQSGALDIQQRQRDMASDAAFRALYNPQPGAQPTSFAGPSASPPSVVTDPTTGQPLASAPAYNGPGAAASPPSNASSGPAAAPPTAAHDIPDSQILGIYGPKGYALIHARNEASKLAADAQKTQGDLQQQNADYWGSIAFGLQGVGFDPAAVKAALSKAVADGKQNTPEYQQFAQAAQQNPAALPQLAKVAMSHSKEQQTLLNERVTASAKQTDADTLKRKADEELAQKDLQNASALLASAPNATARATILARLDPKIAANFEPTWSPGQSARDAKVGQTSQEQVASAETAKRDAQTAENEAAERAISQARLNLEKQRYGQEFGNPLAGVSDADMARLKAIANGDIPAPTPRSVGYQKTIDQVLAVDPTYTAARFASKQDFKTKGDANSIVQMATALSHLDRAAENSGAVGTASLQRFNLTPEMHRYSADVDLLTGEVGKLVKNGVVSEGESNRMIDNLRSWSQSNRDAALDELKDLMNGKIQGIAQKYKAATGQELPRSMFDPATQARMAKYKIGADDAAPSAASAPVAATPHGIPDLGSTFNGHKVLKVEKVN